MVEKRKIDIELERGAMNNKYSINGVFIMKNVIKLASLMFLMLIIFAGCSSSDENNAKKVAEQFGKSFYTVDSKEVTQYNILSKAQSTQLTSSNDIDRLKKFVSYQTSIESLVDKDIKPLMTEKAYKIFISNRDDIMNVKACSTNNYVMEATDFTVTEDSYNNEQNTATYDYKTKLKLISSKDKSTHSDSTEGQITLSKQSGQWKVSIFTITVGAKLLTEK